ncbi:hypothetical protein [Variovorax sp. EBFNA2]|uniref:hypothetical protein n=1 Tax=Variovorax sp. EBFNA2 TaxID=3342097 RepID=UPI0029C05255|nr:hypothetical protein [Variovorax boronicumulans]WPG38744.1 hypothetical protein RZE79_05275 [Variovorax boronicumulans]
MTKIKTVLSNGYARAGAIVGGALLASPAFAQTSPWDAFFDAVDFSGVSAKVIAGGLLIVGIAVAYKGPDLAKRLVRKA